MESGLSGAGVSLRHKAQFHKRLHADVKKKVKDPIDVKERDLCLSHARHQWRNDHAHIIIQKSMKAQILKSDVPVRFFDLFLHICPQDRGSMTRTYT